MLDMPDPSHPKNKEKLYVAVKPGSKEVGKVN